MAPIAGGHFVQSVATASNRVSLCAFFLISDVYSMAYCLWPETTRFARTALRGRAMDAKRIQ
jgi:hypothetical protein